MKITVTLKNDDIAQAIRSWAEKQFPGKAFTDIKFRVVEKEAKGPEIEATFDVGEPARYQGRD